MTSASKYVSHTLLVKNMVCDCCTVVIEQELKQLGVEVKEAVIGEIQIRFNPQEIELDEISLHLKAKGFPVIANKELQLVEKIKLALIDLIHHSTYNAMIRNSDYLVQKFNVTYQYISTIFSKHEGITLEKYIILLKIEKVKELIEYGELSLSEIAFMMEYSSVQYLSTQFKNSTGYSVTEYKKQGLKLRKPLNNLTENS